MTATNESKSDLKAIRQSKFEKMKERDHKIVKGIFRCFEPRGGSMTFSFKKYRGDPVYNYTMEDGKTYDIPLMVAKHLNNNCRYTEDATLLDANGNPHVGAGKVTDRCTFDSLDFVDDE